MKPFRIMFLFLRPKWKKQAMLTLKAANHFLNYKKDLLPQEFTSSFITRRDELKAAIKANSPELAEAAGAKLISESAPYTHQKNWLAENAEVFFVAIVIALGVRTYFLQPFRIPTGSMQPSLNGIRAWDAPPDSQPGFLGQIRDFLVTGSSYYNEVANNDKALVKYEDASNALMTRTRLRFSDGSSFTVAATPQSIRDFIARHNNGNPNPSFHKGQPILQAKVDTGDLVLVDKVSYHFRKPSRGEVFVFDTRDIEGISDRESGVRRRSSSSAARKLADQQGGQHYIKRLAGLPGDTLEIRQPNLIINGKIASEPSFQRVQSLQPPYNPTGYNLASPAEGPFKRYLDPENVTFTLAKHPENPNMNEYAALGDNTENSLDSRFWGPVKEYNLVGPGLFSLWPFTSHWGTID